ncbi:hypothetical protein [Streptosporangium minutum]|uniref:hypothetical protein n=1 Tax=Streptosporangium minutum TaxID=569862 RepID=UPI001F60F41C|nr:hypothetical protein [Streptosporangium minutum]
MSTGGALHPQRRAAVIDWARATDGLLLEDDYDGEFRYDREPVGAVQGLDPDRVVYFGSTSKSLSPALRLGWMALPGRLVDDIVAAKGSRELWSGVTDQLTLADFVAGGAYDRQLRRMRGIYRRRRDLLTAVLAERAPHITVSGIAAGLHAVLELPPGTEQAALRAASASPWTAWAPICTPTVRCRHATAWSSDTAHHPSTRSQPPWKPSASPCPARPHPCQLLSPEGLSLQLLAVGGFDGLVRVRQRDSLPSL